jgi:hypothetical protein
VLAGWADDPSDPVRSHRAQDAYLSTAALYTEDGPLFYLTVDAGMLAQLRRRADVEELPD